MPRLLPMVVFCIAIILHVLIENVGLGGEVELPRGPAPGPRAARHWELARRAGLKTAAKVQLNNSWELGTIPYLPAMDLVAEHCRNLARLGVDGMMLSWSLGGYPSPNLQLAARFAAKPLPTIDEALDAEAAERYGAAAAPLGRRAWTAFSRGMREYPHDITVVYQGPVQIGPANPLYPERTGYKATMTGFPYDDVDGWRGPYPAEAFAAQYEKTAEGWRAGLAPLREALEKSPADRRENILSDLRMAEAAAIHFQSVANQTRYVLARDELAAADKNKLSPQRREELRTAMHKAIRGEIDMAKRLFALANADSRIGFEASNHYMYLPLDLAEKVVACRRLLEQQ